MIGFLFMAMMSTGAVSSPPTLGQWAKQDSAIRRLSMVGAMEGVLLASSGPNGANVPVDVDCFSTETPDSLENSLLAQARMYPDIALASGILRLSQCVPKRGEK